MPSVKSSSVRQFDKEDIPQVADLYRRVFLPRHQGSREALQASLEQYFNEIFFDDLWQDEFISSLVCVNAQEQLTGFIGVIPRRMLFRERSVVMANSFHFMADPDRPTLAGVQLMKELFAGPQDLTFTDHGGDVGRRVWEGFGGMTSLVQSFNWVRLLRPAAHANRLASARSNILALGAGLTRPLCNLADWAFPKMVPRWLESPAVRLREIELDASILHGSFAQFSDSYALRPDYDMSTLRWLWRHAERFEQLGCLQKVALMDEQERLAGSFLYYLNAGRTSHVLHLAAAPDRFEDVLKHLFNHAARRGALALTGRLDPRRMREMTNQFCRFDGAGGWTMVHTHDPELIQAIHSGDAWLSRLEGEGCFLYPA